MVLASAMEPLRDVKIRSVGATLEWQISTLNNAPVKSSSGLSIEPDTPLPVLERNHTVILVAGYGVRRLVNPEALLQIRLATRSAGTILGLDTAPWLMAATGLLDDHDATIHWQELDAFQEHFPAVNVTTQRFVKSGRMRTCGGASTALDLILDLIREKFGAAAAFDATTMFIYDPERQNKLRRGPGTLKHQGSPALLTAINVMAENIEHPLLLGRISQAASTSLRTLNRLFLDELGTSPGKYYQMLRLGRARDLALETDLSIEQIALRCGFTSAQSLSRSFSGTHNTSISSIRKGKPLRKTIKELVKEQQNDRSNECKTQ